MYFVIEFEMGAILATVKAVLHQAFFAWDQRLPASLAAPRRACLDNHIALLCTSSFPFVLHA
jgi:hypothetical protein